MKIQVESQVFSSLKFPFWNISTINYSGDDDEDWMWMWVVTKRTDCEEKKMFSHSLFNHIHQSSLPLKTSDDFRFPGDDIELQLQFVISSRERHEKRENLLSPALLIFSILLTRAINLFLLKAKHHRISWINHHHAWCVFAEREKLEIIPFTSAGFIVWERRIYASNVIWWFAFFEMNRREVQSAEH
jgi:hypothetical protein